LHYDNLAALVKADPKLGLLRSYCTVRRYMQAHGMLRRPRPQPKGRAGEDRAAQRRESREIRSYEAEYVGSLWHLDFHHGSLKVLTHRGQWQRPIVLGILDDHSRLCCHAQWYLSETAEDLVHGLSQAIQKRGLPRALLSDNGSAMVAEEVTGGLLRLGIVHDKTLPYSAYQNGKQEAFWGTLEGRLMEMLEGCVELTLDFLNTATQAWVEIEYNRAVHREIGCSPRERFACSPDVLRASPVSNALRDAFRLETQRRQRTSDGTISLEGTRFEVPARYRHFRDVAVRYARWDLGRVDLVDPRSGAVLAPLYPLDRTANADGRRAVIEPSEDASVEAACGSRPDPELPPLLQRILDEYSATGIPPAYLPQKPRSQKGSKP
jgi:putative transposase